MSVPLRRVFVIVPDCLSNSGHYGPLWHRHFELGVTSVADSVTLPQGVDFTWARSAQPPPGTQGLRRQCSQSLWEQIRSAVASSTVDSVISYCFSDDLEPGLVRRVRGLGIPWINFYCDSTHRFAEVRALASEVTLNWFPETAAQADYADLGVPALCAPYALNPAHLPDLGCESPERPVGFVGVPSTNRITQLGLLQLFGCPVVVRGKGWVDSATAPFESPLPLRHRLVAALSQRGMLEKVLRRCFWPSVRKAAGPALSDAEFGAFIKRTSIILGLNQGRDPKGRLLSYMKFRDIEFPGYGCCYLTEGNPDMDRAFRSDEEVLVYRTMREAAAQVRKIASEPELARSIGRRARARVLRDHSWTARINTLRQAISGVHS